MTKGKERANFRSIITQMTTDLQDAAASGEITVNRHTRRALAKLNPQQVVQSIIPDETPQVVEKGILARKLPY